MHSNGNTYLRIGKANPRKPNERSLLLNADILLKQRRVLKVRIPTPSHALSRSSVSGISAVGDVISGALMTRSFQFRVGWGVGGSKATPRSTIIHSSQLLRTSNCLPDVSRIYPCFASIDFSYHFQIYSLSLSSHNTVGFSFLSACASSQIQR